MSADNSQRIAMVTGPNTPSLSPTATAAPSPSSSCDALPDSLGCKTFNNATEVSLAQETSTQVDSCATSMTEKGYDGWEGYKEEVLPEKTLPKKFRNLRFIVLNIYRRLFSICFLTNLGILIWLGVRGSATTPYIGNIVIGNIFAAICIRNEFVVNTLFKIFTSVPQSAPLWLRTTVARVYSLGGIHSGSSVAATMWLVYLTVNVTIDLVHHQHASAALVGITYSILTLLLIIVALAMPTFRKMHHDSFEMVHRFMGWSATGLLWAQVVILIRDYKEPGVPLHIALRESAAFWLVVILTASIITPWLSLKKVKVDSKLLSQHALQMSFDYTDAIPGSFTRVSTSPLTEWHSFATIAVPGKKGYSMIVSRAGDWTSNAIAEPPSQLWVRGVPTCGVMNIVPLFRRLVIVATGSGIAPCAPHVFAKKAEIKLLWTSRNIRKTYGDEFVDSIMEAAPDAIIYDTDAHGRPDLVKLVHHVYKEFDAEAVCIIANEPITKKVVYGLMTRGVPAFGAIWDS